MSYKNSAEEESAPAPSKQELLNVNTSPITRTKTQHGSPKQLFQTADKEHYRHYHHVHTHNGSPTTCIISSTIPPDASAIALGSLVSGKKSNVGDQDSKDHGIQATKCEDVTARGETVVDSAMQNKSQEKPRKAIIIRKSFPRSSETDGMSVAEREALLKNKIVEAVTAYTHGDTDAANRLAEIARTNGIPGSLRKPVWKILLETHPLVRASKTSPVDIDPSLRKVNPSSEIPLKRIHAELSRYHRRRKNIPNTRHASPPQSGSPGNESTTSSSTATTASSAIAPPDADALDQAALDTAVEEAVVAYLESHSHIAYAPGMIHVCLALSDWIFTPPSLSNFQEFQSAGLVEAFDQMMTIILWSSPSAPSKAENKLLLDGVLSRRISHFLTIFRKLMPELAAYFDEEEANGFGEEWVHYWIQWWCARELSKDDKGRLWDFYLGYRPSSPRPSPAGPFPVNDPAAIHIDSSDGDGEDDAPIRPVLPGDVNGTAVAAYTPADWHPFICLALLRACKDALEELELSEIRTLLTRLPRINMDAIIREAGKMRRELRVLNDREDEEALRRSLDH